jgi:hypothetical protein
LAPYRYMVGRRIRATSGDSRPAPMYAAPFRSKV